tara:strand:+ start:1843 stop:2709 length:867 start_codon:yes stop_codon:yes gene_type:complete
MTVTIDQNYVNQFSDMVHDLVEQKGSKLMGLFPKEIGNKGEYHFFDRLGSVEVTERTTRFEEPTLQDGNHSRRAAFMKDYRAGPLGISDMDKIRMLVDPQSGYAKKIANSLGRQFDIDCLEAMVGSALTGKSGGGTQALSAGQIDSTEAALSTARLIAAKAKFVENNVSDKLYCAVDHEGLKDLLADTEVQNSDYNTVKALVNGEVNTWMGIEFIQFGNGIIPEETAGSVTRAIVFTQDAIKVAMGKGIELRVDERNDLDHTIQVVGYASFGMVRMEEELVYSIEVTY